MKVSYNWLKEYISLDGVTAEELADKLTTAGLEVEDLYPVASGTNLVIGKVVECYPHPDSDHLSCCKVDIKTEILNIVCGAPNVKAGIKVIVAKVGAKLPQMEIKAGLIRGQESNGMLCSLLEIGVSEHNLTPSQIEGIEELNLDAPVGNTDVLEYLKLDDYVLDIGLTFNRKDCLSMWNIAKEVGAVLKRDIDLPKYENQSKVGVPTKFKLASKTQKCPKFLGKVVNNVKVKSSPIWMREYLHAAGIKSINNVVDISNYVMLETGQPLHFYDLSKLASQEITVVDDIEMKLTALDGVEYNIQKGDLMITTNGVATGIAGIMGGDESKIDENTTSIFIEAADFNLVSIRNTSRRLGLNTDACFRFTKGLEPLAQYKAVDRCVGLLTQLAEANGFEENVSFGNFDYQVVKVAETISHANTLLGTNFTEQEIKDTLYYLDFDPVFNGDEFVCTIPSYRTDVTIREDIDEEIIRLIGFDSLKTTLPLMEATAGELTKEQKARRLIRSFLTGQGVSEVVTYTLVSDKFIKNGLMPFGDNVKLFQPLSEERKYIRNSMMYSMLECKSYNTARKANNTNIFEISNVYSENIYEERLGILLSDSLQKSILTKVEIKADFYSLKEIIFGLMAKFGFGSNRVFVKENTTDTVHFNKYASAEIYLGRDLLGIIGNVHPNVENEFNVKNVVYAELKVSVIMKNKAASVKFKSIDRYPASNRDIALVIKEDVLGGEIVKVIASTAKIVKDVNIFDVYQGEHVKDGYKSMAISIMYQSSDHTLNEAEIVEVHNIILEKLKNKFNAELRG
jgi:phenylalanyl-tRNA synthetase beta chain